MDERAPAVPVASHMIEMRDRLEEMVEIVHENAARAQAKLWNATIEDRRTTFLRLGIKY